MTRRYRVALMVGGALVMTGALLPWLTLYAGLQSYRGTIGLYGRVVFAAGAVAVLAGLFLPVGPKWISRGSGLLGGTLLIFVSWLLVGLRGMLRGQLSPMVVPNAGPGLFVAIGGAGLIAATGIIASVRRPSPR